MIKKHKIVCILGGLSLWNRPKLVMYFLDVCIVICNVSRYEKRE